MYRRNLRRNNYDRDGNLIGYSRLEEEDSGSAVGLIVLVLFLFCCWGMYHFFIYIWDELQKWDVYEDPYKNIAYYYYHSITIIGDVILNSNDAIENLKITQSNNIDSLIKIIIYLCTVITLFIAIAHMLHRKKLVIVIAIFLFIIPIIIGLCEYALVIM